MLHLVRAGPAALARMPFRHALGEPDATPCACVRVPGHSMDLYSEPQLLPCLHTFCQACISAAISHAKTPCCPQCRTPVTRRALTHNQSIASILGAFHSLSSLFANVKPRSPSPPKYRMSPELNLSQL